MGNTININFDNGDGITQAILKKLQQDGNVANNQNLKFSIWQQIMNEVAADSEAKKCYTGGSKLNKASEVNSGRASWADNFKIIWKQGADNVIKITQETWNKIVSLATGQPVAKQEAPEEQLQEPDESQELPEEPLQQPDGTENNNGANKEDPTPEVKPTEDTEGTPQNASTPESTPTDGGNMTDPNNADKTPVVEEPAVQKTEENTPKVIDATNMSEAQIQDKIAKLKAGEKIKVNYKENVYVTWTRNADGTLLRECAGTSMTYAKDGITAISSQGDSTYKFKGTSTIFYDETTGSPTSKSTTIDYNSEQTFLDSVLSNELTSGNKDIKSSSIKDNDGNVIVKYENSQYYDKNDNEINKNKAERLISRACKNQTATTFVQEYTKPQQENASISEENPEEEAPVSQDPVQEVVIQDNEPASILENSSLDNLCKKLTEDSLSEKVKQIKELKSSNAPVTFANKNGNTHTITREANGNFIMTTTDKQYYGGSDRIYQTVYSADGKILSKEDNPMSSTRLGTKTLIEYDNNEEPIKATTEITIDGIFNTGSKVRQYAVMERKSFTITNNEGNTILSYHDNQWYDGKNNRIDTQNVTDILDQHERITLIEEFNSSEEE